MPQQCLTKAVFQMRAILRRHDEFQFLDHHLDDPEHRTFLGARVLDELGDLACLAHDPGIGDAAAFGDQA
jgi:hypothetical protein